MRTGIGSRLSRGGLTFLQAKLPESVWIKEGGAGRGRSVLSQSPFFPVTAVIFSVEKVRFYSKPICGAWHGWQEVFRTCTLGLSSCPSYCLPAGLTGDTVSLSILPVEHEYACLFIRRLKTAETQSSKHVCNLGGRYVGLYAKKLPLATEQEKWAGRQNILAKLLNEVKKWWPGVNASIFDPPPGFQSCDGTVWALLELGETASKTCCTRPTANGRACTPCTHSFVGAYTDTWSPTRRELCIPADRPFIHATRILDVVLLKHPVPVCTMGGVFKHRIPISAIPLTTMSSQQRHVWEHTVSLNRWTKHHMRDSKMLIVRPHWYDLIKHTLNCDSVRIYLNRVWEAK